MGSKEPDAHTSGMAAARSASIRPDALTSKRWVFTEYEGSEPSLISFLSRRLLHLDPTRWTERLSLGGTYVNGKRKLLDDELVAPFRVEYFEPPYEPDKAAAFYPTIDASHIIYRAGGLVGVFKPPGLPTLANRDQIRLNVRSQLASLLGHNEIHFPSRLDACTEGVLIVSEDPQLHGRLGKLFEHRKVEKEYRAAVDRAFRWSTLEITRAIGRHESFGMLRTTRTDGQPAVTLATAFEKRTLDGRAATILKLFPKTGRTHQLRVHLSSIGLPLIGDRFYGGSPAPQLCLLSYRLRFPHPIDKTEVEIATPDPFRPKWLNSE